MTDITVTARPLSPTRWPITTSTQEAIKGWEELRLRSYQCPAGKWTIGYGHTGAEVGPMVEWTKNQAESCFLDDLYEKAQGLSNLLGPAATSRNQFEAMLSLSYNTGLANLAKSTLLKAHLAGDFDKAASEFLKWNKAHVKGKLVVLNGLTKRRKAESYLYRHLTSSLAVEV